MTQNFQTLSQSQYAKTTAHHPDITSILLLKEPDSLILKWSSHTLLTQLIWLSKKNQARQISKHGKTNFLLIFPSFSDQDGNSHPSSKILTIPSFREKMWQSCRDRPQDKWKTTRLDFLCFSVAPSVPTLARSSKEWERFRCSGELAVRDSYSSPYPGLGRQDSAVIT